jgi:predicted AAA+ superfamily ATPase
VKAPKIYFRDSGLLHNLLSLTDIHSLFGHPRIGASWEGFALEQFLNIVQLPEAYFWSTHSGAEIDLFFSYRGNRYGVEFKYNEAPKTTKSMRVAISDLQLDHLWIIYPGKNSYPVDEKISVSPLNEVSNITAQLEG